MQARGNLYLFYFIYGSSLFQSGHAFQGSPLDGTGIIITPAARGLARQIPPPAGPSHF